MDSILHDHSTVEGIVEHANAIIDRLGLPRSTRYVGGSEGGYPTIEMFDPRSKDDPIATVLATSVRTMIQDGGFEAWVTAVDQDGGDAGNAAVSTVRHDLDPTVVSDTIARSIAKKTEYGTVMRASNAKQRTAHEAAIAEDRKWVGRVPLTEAEVDAFIEATIVRERDVYAKVRIIERVGDRSKNRFFLVYGDQPDDLSGERTGGFASLDLAREWFVNQGR